MRKKVLCVLLAAALSSICGLPAGAEENSEYFDEPVKLSYMVWDYADRTPSTDKWIADCKEKFNIEIELQNVPTNNYAATLKTKVAADDMPDLVEVHSIAQNYACDDVPVDENTFLDLSDLENVADYNQEIIESRKINGKLYYVPVSQTTLGVLYNKAVFEECGVDIPDTLEEFVRLMDEIKEKGVAPLAGSFAEAWSAQIIPFIATDNYFAKNPEVIKQLYDSTTNVSSKRWADLGEEFNEALGLIREWVEAGYFTDDPMGTDASVAAQLLAAGKAAMFVTGSWEYSVTAAASEDPSNIGFFALPMNEEGEENYISVNSNEGICINAQSENIEAAKVALNYYLSQEIQKEVMTDLGSVSTNTKISSDDAFIAEVTDAINSNTGMPNGWFSYGDGLLPLNITFDKEAECQSLAAGLETPQEWCEKLDASIAEVAVIE